MTTVATLAPNGHVQMNLAAAAAVAVLVPSVCVCECAHTQKRTLPFVVNVGFGGKYGSKYIRTYIRKLMDGWMDASMHAYTRRWRARRNLIVSFTWTPFRRHDETSWRTAEFSHHHHGRRRRRLCGCNVYDMMYLHHRMER